MTTLSALQYITWHSA